MEIVYGSFERRTPGEPPGEVAEALSALWAHARPEDGLEHASGRPDSERLGVLLFLLTRTIGEPSSNGALQRAARLLERSHQASPVLRDRYLPPRVPVPDTRRPSL
ncbi:hypothetical protein [Streptacidiphilus jiangxiensis]|uniref:Uncharacterized protein n=1 Tax=Streptacidiphilus jiangxiensis TaxID=235985 RepID=A0A1H7XSC7_STRJI|nr:hypothetical protein [Streptacidiphilus jiangxiensis]SEM36058.1 hypothetical protein SAMN05414137_1253 [Streptacidiphilus jiangxiensis]